jgi:hypothetical protein
MNKICETIDCGKKSIFFKFIRFLKENGVFISFRRNVENNFSGNSFLNFTYNHKIDALLDATPVDEWINYSMVWDMTPEGWEFWRELNIKWIEIVKDYEI